jgi:outer membrane protein TolC
VLCAAVLALVGCASYSPRPPDPEQNRTVFEARRLSDPVLAQRLVQLLPPPAQPPAGSWGTAELLIAAAHFNPALAEARVHVTEALAAVTTASTIPNPTLALSFEYDLQRYAESPWLWGASTAFLWDSALRRRLRTELAQTGVRAARLDYAEALWGVRRDLRAALLTAVIAERRLALLAGAERDRAELAGLVERRVTAGESAASERLQGELELARTREAAAEAARALDEARARLAVVVGVPVRALEGQTLRFDSLETPEPANEPQLAELRERALLSRADLERAIGDYQAREIELRQQVRAQYPQLTIGPGYLYDHGIRKATLGVSFALPVFDHNRGPIAEASARRDAAGLHLLTVQAQILGDIDAARSAYHLALEALAAAHAQSERARALAESVARGLAVGADDRPTLLAARLAAGADALVELDALERAQQALGQLEDALRAPLAGAETALRLGTEPEEH